MKACRVRQEKWEATMEAEMRCLKENDAGTWKKYPVDKMPLRANGSSNLIMQINLYRGIKQDSSGTRPYTETLNRL